MRVRSRASEPVLSPSRRLCALAEDCGVRLTGSGLTDSDLGLAASLHLFAAFGVDTPVDLTGRQSVESPYADPTVRVETGVALVPDAPGLGAWRWTRRSCGGSPSTCWSAARERAGGAVEVPGARGCRRTAPGACTRWGACAGQRPCTPVETGAQQPSNPDELGAFPYS
ncbi:enolase C-terminal domain-like protein [Streptomyces sp. PmtA]|uniref:enolase C-terminal domain-like protein n=1 Tax=Streptomyces sp. PmtA TaxID=3074275 RepID=UPI0030141F9A